MKATLAIVSILLATAGAQAVFAAKATTSTVQKAVDRIHAIEESLN